MIGQKNYVSNVRGMLDKAKGLTDYTNIELVLLCSSRFKILNIIFRVRIRN